MKLDQLGPSPKSPSDKVVLGVMGLGLRGRQLASAATRIPGVEVAYVCDADRQLVERGVAYVGKLQKQKPRGLADFRAILDDPAVDALVIAAPDHWHAPATLLACAAGKHVFVEKPACHNAAEGELMVQAARKHRRHVQLGAQRRSMAEVQNAIAELQSGVIGNVRCARAWFNFPRPSLNACRTAETPSWINYDLWQGPAPRVPYRENLVHYNWHWFWHWGTGELGDNGVHALDVCRWGMGVDFPQAVMAGGGNYLCDQRETPDVHLVTFDFGGKVIHWEGHNRDPRGDVDGSSMGMAFFGDNGKLVIGNRGYSIQRRENGAVTKSRGLLQHAQSGVKKLGRLVSGRDAPSSYRASHGTLPHLKNFIDSLRGEASLTAEIEEGVKSTLLCHLGNIAYRVGESLQCDPQTGHIVGNERAQALWGREYAPGWEPKV